MSEQKLITKQAQQWLKLMLSDEVSFAEQEQFTRWVATSAMHKEVYFKTRAEHFLQKSRRRYGLQSSVAIAASVLFVLLININTSTTELQQAYQYQKTQASVTLPDGSIVELKKNARFDIHYSKDLRLIILNKGDAHFTVAKDKNRPFVVQYKEVNITALGTAFYVRTHAQLQIQVTEHSINIDSPYGKSIQVEEGAGSRLVENHWQSLSAEQFEAGLAWREKLLVFSSESLDTVLKELELYLGHRINVMNPALLQEKVSGRFQTQSAELALEMIAEGSNLKVKKLINGEILLY